MSRDTLPGSAPKVILKDMLKKISYIEYHVFANRLTVCIMTMHNGYIVTGESSCVSKENYQQELGETYAYENALDKLWALEGYLMREMLHRQQIDARTTISPTTEGPL
jgi:hypothetical protein